MTSFDLSIVIPFYNRAGVIGYALESIRRGTGNLRLEVVLIDDGSDPPASDVLRGMGDPPPLRVIRQENRGLLFARLRGVEAVTGRHTLFLDSDDMVEPGKLTAQVMALDHGNAEVSYTDSAHCVLEGPIDALAPTSDEPTRNTEDIAEFFIDVQPPPHSPVWRTDFLRRAVRDAFIAPLPVFNSVAEIWFYHNAAILPGRVVKVAGPRAIVGQHPGTRLTDRWERLGVASLGVMEAFARHCPANSTTARARQLVAEKAFQSWRRLPRNFSPEFSRRTLAIWRHLRLDVRLDRLGGPLFQCLARIIGPVGAARLLRLRNRPYEACRTVTDEALAELLRALPPP